MADFFTQVMGWTEMRDYEANRIKLLGQAKFTPKSAVAGGYAKEYCEITGGDGLPVSCGTFSTPSVKELHMEVEAVLKDEKVQAAFADKNLAGRSESGKLTLLNLAGESNALHSDPDLLFATVQAASQFNYLEFPGPGCTPELGVTDYIHDATQGPACAIACAAGTMYRNYLAPRENGTRGQTKDSQFNGMEDIEKILATSKHDQYQAHPSGPWKVKNGYIESTPARLDTIKPVLETDPEARRELVEALRIAVHEDIDVTNKKAGWMEDDESGGWVLDSRLEKHKTRQVVTQTYNSAISVGYSMCSGTAWQPVAQLVLDATYEATMLVGILNAAKHAVEHGVVPPILLTKVGGGVFRNEQSWIQQAIERSCASLTRKYGRLPFEVAIVHYGSVERGYEAMQGKTF